jgi:hypothetical protein
MSVPQAEKRILQIKSGNVCAFPGCTERMVKKSTFGTRENLIGEIAHIVSETPDGPRGKHILPIGEHNKHPNLMLMCPNHHTAIDTDEANYTVEMLRQMKFDHETAIEKATIHAKQVDQPTNLSYITETVYSTLLPVTRMPKYIFSAPCILGDGHEREVGKDVMVSETEYFCPFIIRDGGTLFAFNDLGAKDGPFRKVVTRKKSSWFLADSWLEDPDKSRWFVALLNRSLNKLTGRKGLQLDKEHHRYHFNSDGPGKEKEIEYRPLNQSTATRKVVWQPMNTRTNQPRDYWYHLAVNLRFVDAGNGQWCFCIRPEMRVTKDGVTPIESKNIGKHVTRQMAHQYNYDLLEYVNFWRDFLSGGEPRIVLRFSQESMVVISTAMMAADVVWPGMPLEFAMPFQNIEYEEDLFTVAEAQEFEEEEPEPLPGEGEIDDEDESPEG